ncbi:dehydrogenase/reductase SDR family member 13-like [Melitaea cinxia]|uniref:dehydrogenase/reductase SDR family member 13-like n=1 Tax=Melitaea cinxia TaxID=113334 RepID=UPI001E2721FC|nr:dehydrogenase/reductase SDR family member 13-like [Melitaea cinxia]
MSLIVYITITFVIVALIFSLYQKSTNAICTSKKRLDGKTVIVTGGTTGIGLETATDFAERGARVIIACPFQNEGEDALKLITEKTENKDVVFKLLDLSSLASIRKFAADILDTEKRLDILINNAGVGVGGETTDDGMNYIMRVNYFGPFLLTLLLLPLLNKTGTIFEPARIVNVSSVLHNFGSINFDKVNVANYGLGILLYSNSKLGLILFAHELSKKLKGNVVVNCVDPGYVGTRIFVKSGTISGIILLIIALLFFKTPWYGAQTTIFAALGKEAGKASGQIFKNCQLSRAKQSAYDDETAAKLWNKSISCVKLSSEELAQCFR